MLNCLIVTFENWAASELLMNPEIEDETGSPPELASDELTVHDVKKTKLCRHFLRGTCWRMTDCMFAHVRKLDLFVSLKN